ncbi:hypothetical protein MUK42_18281 [Musa troglodytarum]|uniref:Uncharacterized protein n=1 Tax=Musa troglodytarum TaxID=320322 RepID=A0A9E7FEQ0_9LILI|nr:hypothetical protein MUK42_18281 [Musa troglodytarum]
MAVAGIMITAPVEKAGGSLEGTAEELRKALDSMHREGGRAVGGGGRLRRTILACLGHGRASQRPEASISSSSSSSSAAAAAAAAAANWHMNGKKTNHLVQAHYRVWTRQHQKAMLMLNLKNHIGRSEQHLSSPTTKIISQKLT